LILWQEAEGDSDEEDDEDYGLADTYANYIPSKRKYTLVGKSGNKLFIYSTVKNYSTLLNLYSISSVFFFSILLLCDVQLC